MVDWLSLLIGGIILIAVGWLLRALVAENIIKQLGYILFIIGIILIVVAIILLIFSVALFVLPFP